MIIFMNLLFIDEENACLLILDTPGEEKFQHNIKSYYHDAQGVLVVFDLSKKDTFNHVSYWIDSIKEVEESAPIVLVGSNNDLERSVTEEEALEVANKYEASYCETSAKNNENVSELFECIGKQARDYSFGRETYPVIIVGKKKK